MTYLEFPSTTNMKLAQALLQKRGYVVRESEDHYDMLIVESTDPNWVYSEVREFGAYVHDDPPNEEQ